MSSTSFVMPNDLSALCRVCLQLPEESQYLDLTTIYDEEDNLTYGECFTICTRINLSEGEGVPHYLCKSCGLELQMSYDFYKKVEDSRRIIEQCQKQAKVQSLNASEEHNETSCDIEQRLDKYVISDYCMDSSNSNNNDESISRLQEFIGISNGQERNEIEIVDKTIPNEIKVEEDNVINGSIGTGGSSQESNTGADIEEHLDIEDYQNLEALEEEETETIQMNCDENPIPIEITNYKLNDFEVSEEYVEFSEDDEDEKQYGKCNEEVEEDVQREINNENQEKNITWKKNVVVVANKEHIPVECENDNALYETEDIIKNEIETIICHSSHDDTMEEDAEGDHNKKNCKNKQSTNNSHTTRKRHVGCYACDVCQKIYPNYSRMMGHRRCHEADRPKFTCSYCGRMYATKQAMECHIQTAHEKSGFTCSICNKVFAIRKSLEIHVRYHTGDFPYECNLCDRKFAQACHLNTHINVKHHKIRFSCEYPNCGKFFTSSTSLRNHEFTHGVMPFECEYCQRGYPAKAKLRIHIKRKHGMDLTVDQLENMRKFHVMRSKVNLVQFI